MSKPTAAGAFQAMKAVRRGPRVKGPVYEWLSSNYAELARGFRQTSPSWTGLAKYLADNGVLTVDGKPPTANSVRMTWLRVEADQVRRTRRSRAPSDDTHTADPPPAAPTSPPLQPTSVPVVPSSRFDFSSAKPVVSRSSQPRPKPEATEE
jgi:hypothetical protein